MLLCKLLLELLYDLDLGVEQLVRQLRLRVHCEVLEQQVPTHIEHLKTLLVAQHCVLDDLHALPRLLLSLKQLANAVLRVFDSFFVPLLEVAAFLI